MKSPFQDIIPSEKRSIRNISIGEIKSKEKEEVSSPIRTVHNEVKPKKRKVTVDDAPLDHNIAFKGRRTFGIQSIVLWGITLVLLVVAFFGLTHFLSSAVITIEAKSFEVALPSKLALSLQPSLGQVGYSTVTLSDSISDTVPATGEKDVLTKSVGTIVIYNNSGAAGQKLVSGTRFESSKGLIYKLDKTVTVPGVKKISGKNVPGSLEATVTAEKAGKEYNIELDDFTIPGFKGTAKAGTVYARSKTPMTGGNVGKVATVKDEDLTRKISELKAKLEIKLREKASKELPGNQVSFPNLSITSYVVGDPVFSNSKAVVTVTQNKKIYLLDANTLAKSLISTQGATVQPNDEFIFMLDNASASFVGSTTDVSSIGFGGKTVVTYKLDVDKFKQDLLGVDKSNIPSIALKYNAISKITTSIKPFWKSSIPKDIDKITINLK